MAHEPRKVPVKVKVQDKRKVRVDETEGTPEEVPQEPGAADAAEAAEAAESDVSAAPDPGDGAAETGSVQPNPSQAEPYLQDLMRLQADFDNYRKRMMREQARLDRRAAARVVERLLPVLDNFDQAIAHGEGGEGVALVYKQLIEALQQEGLEEIPAENAVFDPALHEAVDSHEDPDVSETVVRSVLRRGYRMGDKLLRAAMVSVSRPADPPSETGDAEQQASEPSADGQEG